LKADFSYARAKDKTDKSLEAFKFYINALYVAMTRAVQNLYIIERDTGHRVFRLLGLNLASREVKIKSQVSTAHECHPGALPPPALSERCARAQRNASG
jgi:ATP-dependent exoDNAse (exonuclease V) beta subunit